MISNHDIDHEFSTTEYTSEHYTVVKSIINYLISSPILQRADSKKSFYLKTDFSSVGLGFTLCQPGDSAKEIAAMTAEDNGTTCQFDTIKSGLRLHPVAFGARKTIGNEKHFHSHPGESLAATWEMNKNRHFLWGKPITLITDCRALLWLMSYDGHNHAVRRLQLEMLGYWFTIVNRPGHMLEDANYFSRLNEDKHIDPLLKGYLEYARHLYSENMPENDEITPDNMPGRRKKRALPTANIASNSTSHLVQIYLHNMSIEVHVNPQTTPEVHQVLCHHPVTIINDTSCTKCNNYNNSYIAYSANVLATFKWCLLHPRHGHFLQAASQSYVKFDCMIAVEPNQSCANTLQQKYDVPHIAHDIETALLMLSDNKTMESIQGCYIILDRQRIPANDDNKTYNNITMLISKLRALSILIIETHPCIPMTELEFLLSKINKRKWRATGKTISYPSYNDYITGSVNLQLCTNKVFYAEEPTVTFLTPPLVPRYMADNIYVPFNDQKYSIPLVGKDVQYDHVTSISPDKTKVLGLLHPYNSNKNIQLGYQIYDTTLLAPLPTDNYTGFFGQLYGLSYIEPNPLHSFGV